MSHPIDPDIAVQVSLGTSLILIIAVLGVLCHTYIRDGGRLIGLCILIGMFLVVFWLLPTFIEVTQRMLEHE